MTTAMTADDESSISAVQKQRYEQPMVSEHSGEAAYALGMIDILEGYSSGWHAQAVILGFICRVFHYPGNARGITAVHPTDYALRFDEFMQDRVLGIEPNYDEWRKTPQEGGETWIPWK